MKNSKHMGKKAVVMVIFAAGALIAGSVGAMVNGHAVSHPTLTGHNQTNGCVRFYVDPRYPSDIPAHGGIKFGVVSANHQYMADVFPGACGGKAIKNVWFKTDNSGRLDWYVK